MFYRFYTPGPPLGEFIDRIWLCSDRPPHSRERILPSGTVELVINLCEDEIRIYDPSERDFGKRFSGAIVSGTYSKFFVIDPIQHASIMGVHFKPGGAFPFLGVPAGELADTHVDLQVLWGSLAVRLRERLCAATPAERFRLLEEALISRLRNPPDRHPAVSVALDMFEQSAGVLRVRDIAQRIGVSQRRFIQVFTTEVGLTPKLYSRIRRFKRAREVAGKIRATDWAEVALDCGYFDQSHFIREFRAFSGITPMTYLKQSSERVIPDHVPSAE